MSWPAVALFACALALMALEAAALELCPNHHAARTQGLTDVTLAGDELRARADGPLTALLVLRSANPLELVEATGAQAHLKPGWDGTLGYSLYGLELQVPGPGPVVVKLRSVLPPAAPVPTTPEQLAEFAAQLARRSSRFPDGPADFPAWRDATRARLAGWLMNGGLPRRVPLLAAVLETKDYPHFVLRKVQYHSQPDRTNILLLSLPKGVAKPPVLLALHGHEAPWGEADPAAFTAGHPDDFCAYFADRDWAVVQPATMNHALQHPGWTLQGEWTWDALVALDYAQTLPELDTTRLAVCGLSTGAHLALNVLALDDRVQAGVVGCILSSWHHMTRFRIPPHCDCGISGQLGGRLEQCDWAALSAPKTVQYQYGRLDAAFCPGADPKALDLHWNTGVEPTQEWDLLTGEVKRAYALCAKPEALAFRIHAGKHSVNNEAAYAWLRRWLERERR